MKQHPFHLLDTFVGKVINRLPRSLYALSLFIGAVVRPGLWAIVLLALAIFFFASADETHFVYVAVMLAVLPLSSLLKVLVRRKRPKTPYTDTLKIKSYSFPSSHVYAATIGAVALSTLAGVSLALLWIIPAISILVLIVAVSRVVIGAHYATDVVGALCIGIGVAVIVGFLTGMYHVEV